MDDVLCWVEKNGARGRVLRGRGKKEKKKKGQIRLLTLSIGC